MEIKVGDRFKWESDSPPEDYLTITRIDGDSVLFRCDDGYKSDAFLDKVKEWIRIGETITSDSTIIPAHYNDSKIDALMVIDDWKLDFRLGNTIKYIQRHEKKGNPLQDLKKAAQYLALKIKQLEDETK